MIHDIAHCSRHTCPLKDTCYRYLAYLEAIERNLDYVTMIVWDKDDYTKENCDIYWEVKKESNETNQS